MVSSASKEVAQFWPVKLLAAQWKTACLGGRKSGLPGTTFPAEMPFLSHSVSELVQDRPVVAGTHLAEWCTTSSVTGGWKPRSISSPARNDRPWYGRGQHVMHKDMLVFLEAITSGECHSQRNVAPGWHGVWLVAWRMSQLDWSWSGSVKHKGTHSCTLPMDEVLDEDTILQVLLITGGDQSLQLLPIKHYSLIWTLLAWVILTVSHFSEFVKLDKPPTRNWYRRWGMGHKDQFKLCKWLATTYPCQVFIPSFKISSLGHEQHAAFQYFFLETRTNFHVATDALGRD